MVDYEHRSRFFKERPTYATEGGRFKALVAIAMLHFTNDLHPSLLPTFLPEIVNRLGLSLGQAGFLNTFFGMFNLVLQPIAGHFADKLNRPVFTLWAPLLTAGGAYLLSTAPNYAIAMLFVAIMGTGTASFHPQAHGLTGVAGGTGKLGAYLAIFASAGTLGSALSPAYGVFLWRTLGPGKMAFALFPVLIAVLVARYLLPAYQKEPAESGESSAEEAASDSVGSSMWRVFLICLPIIMISIIRDSTSQGIRVFLPLLVTGRGGTIEMGATLLFVFTLASSMANLVGGKLADLFGKRRIIVIMLLLSPVFLFPAIVTDGMLSVALFVCGGACIAATSPVTLAMAQEFVPGARSTASSLVMGISWGMANVVASPIGMLADRIGLATTLCLVALMPLLAVGGIAAGYLAKRTKG